MIGIALAGIRRRIASFLAVFVSVLIGAALLTLSGAMLETGIRLPSPPVRLGAADLIVIGDPGYTVEVEGDEDTDTLEYAELHRLDRESIGEVREVAGVAAALPVVLFDGVASHGSARIAFAGRPWSSAQAGPFRLEDGAAPEGRQAVLSQGLADTLGVRVGDDIELGMLGASHLVTVAGLVAGGPDTLFLADDLVEQSIAPDSVDAIAVLLEPGASIAEVRAAIEDRLPQGATLEGDARGRAEDPGASASAVPTIVVGAVFGGIVTVVLATVVSATVSLAIAQRRRELALLRATGASTRWLRSLVVGETALVAVLAAVIGVAIGTAAGSALLPLLRGLVLGPSVQPSIGPVPMAAALVVSAGAAIIAALIAARPLLRTTAVQALREASLPDGRIGAVRVVLGLVFGGGAVALAVLTTLMPPTIVSATSGPAALAAAIAFALLAPPLVRLGSRVFSPVTGLVAGPLSTLVGIQVRARSALLATVATSVVLVVGIGAGHLVAAQLERAAAADAAVATLDADTVVSVPTGIDGDTIGALADADGVETASRLVLSGGRIESPFDTSHLDDPWPLRGIDASGAGVVAETVIEGAFDRLTGDTVAMPAPTAEALGVGLGDDIALRLGDGALVELELVATFESRPGRDSLYLPADVLAPHTVARVATTALVLGELPTDALPAGAISSGPDGLRALAGAQLALQEFINQLLVGLAIAYAAVSVANTLAVGILSRKREFALQRLTGSDTRQVRRMLRAELFVVMLVGAAGGLLAAGFAIVPTAIALGVGPFTLEGAVVTALLLATVAALVARVASLATRRALRDGAGATVAAG